MAKLFGISGNDILARFDRLTDREQKLIYAMLGVFVFGVIAGGLFWINKIGNDRRERIALLERQTKEIHEKKLAYIEAKGRKERFENNRTNDLLSYLVTKENNLGLQADIGTESKGSVVGTFQQTNIPMALRQSVSIDGLTALLKEIEGPNRDGVVKVISLKVSSNSNAPDMLDASMTVATWNRKR